MLHRNALPAFTFFKLCECLHELGDFFVLLSSGVVLLKYYVFLMCDIPIKKFLKTASLYKNVL
ncbi:hypothetical protein IGB42_02745 [Andreprevotia sp. IGB-42]|nr:hypothetical protein IGB42_02745 [Andreprevotia sp. IGB-42]